MYQIIHKSHLIGNKIDDWNEQCKKCSEIDNSKCVFNYTTETYGCHCIEEGYAMENDVCKKLLGKIFLDLANRFARSKSMTFAQ